MAAYQVEGKELKKLVGFAKEKPVAFAFNPGAKEDEHYFGLDRKKPAKMIAKEAKEVGKGKKVAFGNMSVAGMEMRLTCERQIVGMAKKLKKWLKKQKVGLNVIIMDADGNIVESDIDEDAAAAEPQGQETVDVAAIMARLQVISDRIKALPKDARAQFAKPFKTVVAQARAGKVAASETGAEKLETALDKLEKAAAANPDAAKWAANAPKVKAAVADALDYGTTSYPDNPDLTKLKQAWNWANEAAGGKDADYGKALAALPAIVALVKKVRTAQPSDGSGAAADQDAQPFADARQTWQAACSKMDAELKKLQVEIAKVCKAAPELASVLPRVKSLADHVAGLDGRLEKALTAIINADAGDMRDKGKTTAVKVLDEFRKELNSDFFKKVDSQNGFAEVAIAKTAHTALNEVSNALS
ncbi:MAG: hypothetical protein AAF625_12535 [Pseudomonadota bacterium]